MLLTVPQRKRYNAGQDVTNMLNLRELVRIVAIALLSVSFVHAAESIRINKLDREVWCFLLTRSCLVVRAVSMY